MIEVTKEQPEYLTDEEIDNFKEFMRIRNISYAKISKTGRKTTSIASNYWFGKKKFKRLIARDIIKRLEEESLTGFELVKNI